MMVMRLGLQRALRETFQDFSRTFTPAALTELTATNFVRSENTSTALPDKHRFYEPVTSECKVLSATDGSRPLFQGSES